MTKEAIIGISTIRKKQSFEILNGLLGTMQQVVLVQFLTEIVYNIGDFLRQCYIFYFLMN